MLRQLLRRGSLQSLVSSLQPSIRAAPVLPLIPSSLAAAISCRCGWAELLPALVRWKSSAPNVGLKAYKPTTPGFRGRVVTKRTELWKGRPYRPLTEGLRKTGGRNWQGRITAWHRGGGSKRLYRMLDFRRDAAAGPAVVERLEYDPNRSARIALVKHLPLPSADGADHGAADASGSSAARYSYIIAPQHISAGDSLASGPEAAIRPGNTLPLANIPVGTAVHNVELYPGRGGQMARSAGTSATLIGKGDGGPYGIVRLPSGEQRSVLLACRATIGVVSNPQHKNRKHGKAGARRWLGRRPVVRGVAMNPVDHPHGGGRGKRKGRISQTPWGIPTKGYRTRHNPRTDQYIRLSRHKVRAAS